MNFMEHVDIKQSFTGSQMWSRQKNRYIVADPGKRSFEVIFNPCTFYTLLSHESTLGDKNGEGSAIYFCGENITHDRLMHIQKKSQNKQK